MTRTFIADFEATTTKKNCFVWAWATCEVGNLDNVVYGTNIDDFMEWCEKQPDNIKVLFHNMKYDSQFLFAWLFRQGYTYANEPRDRISHTFRAMINSKGLYYSIEVIFFRKGKKINKVTFQDSYKLIPMSVEEIGKAFKIPELQKLKLDYDSHNDLPPDTPLTPEEIEYITHDVQIVAHAVDFFYSQGMTKMTIGACALEEYKNLITPRVFKRWFPVPKYHRDVKQSYRGGHTYLMPEFAGKTVKNGLVLDINSMYPFIMRTKLLPFGTPIFYYGKYKPDATYPLYIQMIRCSFKLKEGKLPTIQLKNNMFFTGSEFLTSSDRKEITLCLTSVDLALFFDNYDVFNPEYIAGWKFRAAAGVMFNDYVDKWINNKIESKKAENYGLTLISKLMLNSLSGKFGTDNRVKSKIPYLAKNGVVRFFDTDPVERDGIYLPMASFITSYGRDMIVRAAQKITDDYRAGKSNIQFVYCDTDSLHIVTDDYSIPEGLNIDKYELGAFKIEGKFNKAKYLKSKCYIENLTEDLESENPEYKLKVTVSGMPESCHKQVTFENFEVGAVYHGKLKPQLVEGGVVLEDIDFTIKK